jgi:hypothetical protein
MKLILPMLLITFVIIGVGCSGDSTSTTSPDMPSPAEPSPSPPMPTPPEEPTSQVLRSATFEGASGYSTSGSASIIREGDAFRLELGSDFRTENSAALDVRLCVDTSCGGSEFNLGLLMRTSGKQSYDLPNDGSDFRYVVIWCRAVSLPFGVGELR